MQDALAENPSTPLRGRLMLLEKGNKWITHFEKDLKSKSADELGTIFSGFNDETIAKMLGNIRYVTINWDMDRHADLFEHVFAGSLDYTSAVVPYRDVNDRSSMSWEDVDKIIKTFKDQAHLMDVLKHISGSNRGLATLLSSVLSPKYSDAISSEDFSKFRFILEEYLYSFIFNNFENINILSPEDELLSKIFPDKTKAKKVRNAASNKLIIESILNLKDKDVARFIGEAIGYFNRGGIQSPLLKKPE